MKRVLLPWLCLAVLGAEAGCVREATPNILMIVIDTLRPDRLGAYDDQRGLTPFLDTLDDRAFVFRNAYAQTSWTNASIASLVTSRYQSQHHVTSFKSTLADEEQTLTEVLKAHGYVTGGFCANFLVLTSLGFGQGFDQYQIYARTDTDATGKTNFEKERADRVNREALKWLDSGRTHAPTAPVFLYLHYMEPHSPYDPPEPFLDHVLGGRPRPERAAINARMRFPNIGRFSDEVVQGVKDLYDAEVMSLDAQLRELFAELQTRALLDNAIIVILADHGEEFHEHGLMGHHQTLFEEVIRVPLLLIVPGNHRRVDITSIVSLTDVAPTLLDLAGITAPASFEGHSLRQTMGIRPAGRWPLRFLSREHETPAQRPAWAFSELIKETTNRQGPHEHAVITDAGKLIADVGGGHEYYDLHADPGETNADALAETERTRLTTALSDMMQHGVAPPAVTGTAAMDAETRERMRALGYTE